jgi:hypothetical protein
VRYLYECVEADTDNDALLVKELTLAWGEELVAKKFVAAVEACECSHTKTLLSDFCRLYITHCMLSDTSGALDVYYPQAQANSAGVRLMLRKQR